MRKLLNCVVIFTVIGCGGQARAEKSTSINNHNIQRGLLRDDVIKLIGEPDSVDGKIDQYNVRIDVKDNETTYKIYLIKYDTGNHVEKIDEDYLTLGAGGG